uniref:Vacuolar protein sorting-associated protein 54 N-terminal domain-containing protein n=1 Tax=Picea sitchensis TaxID=3332 RepID=D5ADV9_PICSI|nr:unknown [Picea sitchensis]
MLQEKLSHYLDIVEVHLVKEISVRSDLFFEAQGQLQDLNGQIVEACAQLRELKATVKLLDVDLVESARQIQELSGSRANLLAIHQKLKLMSYVNQALSALKLVTCGTIQLLYNGGNNRRSSSTVFKRDSERSFMARGVQLSVLDIQALFTSFLLNMKFFFLFVLVRGNFEFTEIGKI